MYVPDGLVSWRGITGYRRNTILGVGTMAMPYALMLCGVSVYVILMLGVCVAAKIAVGKVVRQKQRICVRVYWKKYIY